MARTLRAFEILQKINRVVSEKVVAVWNTRRISVPEGHDILEIGYCRFFHELLPRRTTYVAVGASPQDEARADLVLGPRTLAAFRRLVGHPAFKVVMCRISSARPSAWPWVVRALCGPADFAALGQRSWSLRPQIGRQTRQASLIVVDFEDEATIHPSDLPLLHACRLYFKRELPADRWRLLIGALLGRESHTTVRANPRYRALVSKLHPLSLGLPLVETRHSIPLHEIRKTIDLFVAGSVDTRSWVRRAGMVELEALRADGISVEINVDPLAPAAFYRRSAQAYITWSPEGFGWDCWRHYEAAACRSVPLINYPPTERHAPLRQGEHALFYDPSPGGLTRAVLAALADKPKLLRMAEVARAHVLAHHTPEAIAEMMVSRAMATE